MKKLLTLTAAALVCMLLLTNIPEARALDIPDFSGETTEEVVPETFDPNKDDF